MLSSSSCSNGGGLGASRSPPKSQPDRAVRGRSQKDRPRDSAETPSRILPGEGKCPRRRRVRERVRRAPSWENGGAKPQWGGPVGCLGGIWGCRDKAGLGGPCSTQVWGCMHWGPAAVLGNGHPWGQQEPPNSGVGANRGVWGLGAPPRGCSRVGMGQPLSAFVTNPGSGAFGTRSHPDVRGPAGRRG